MYNRPLTVLASTALTVALLACSTALAGSASPSGNTAVVPGYTTHTYSRVFLADEDAKQRRTRTYGPYSTRAMAERKAKEMEDQDWECQVYCRDRCWYVKACK